MTVPLQRARCVTVISQLRAQIATRESSLLSTYGPPSLYFPLAWLPVKLFTAVLPGERPTGRFLSLTVERAEKGGRR